MGSDDTKTIRVEAGPLGSFDTKCINAIVTVTGTLKEQRVDEAYLQNWEAKLKAQTEKSHGETAAGCDSEKKHAVKQPAPLKPVLRTSRKDSRKKSCYRKRLSVILLYGSQFL